MALPIGFLVLMIAHRIWKITRPSPVNFAVKLIPLSLPLVLCLIGLGWYNWARFGSVTETGFSYALAGVHLQKYQNELFSPVYIIQNLYNYILKPPSGMAQFPFLYPDQGIKHELFRFYSLPKVYETSPVTGLLFIAPLLIFALVPIVILIVKTIQNTPSKWIEKDDSYDLMGWISISLLGAFSSAFGLLLIFFWAAMRYLGDFMPALTILSVFGLWQGYQLLGQSTVKQRIYLIIAIALAITGVVINTLLSLSVQQFGFHGFSGIG